MRILYLSQYFPPEVGATQIRAYEMARGLIAAGHQVTMIAEFPNHPTGIMPQEYRRKLFERSELDGIHVIRVWVRASPLRSFQNRLVFYLSYMFMAILAGLFLARGKFDAIYATSPPLFVAGAGLVISILRRTPLIFEVRDLWPESAIVLGELNNERFIRWATWFEERCYTHARLIVVTANEIRQCLLERGFPDKKIIVIRNGANTLLFRRDAKTRQKIRNELAIQDRFVIIYAGLHGLAYDLEGLIDSAAEFEGEGKLHFLLIGDGPTKLSTETKARSLGLTNVTFLPSQPRERIPDYYNAADLAIIPLRYPQIAGHFPVKIYDSMACEVPVVVAAFGEPRQVVEENSAGLAVDPGDRAALNIVINRLYSDPVLREKFGCNGRLAVEAKYSRQAQARQLAETMVSLLSQKEG